MALSILYYQFKSPLPSDFVELGILAYPKSTPRLKRLRLHVGPSLHQRISNSQINKLKIQLHNFLLGLLISWLWGGIWRPTSWSIVRQEMPGRGLSEDIWIAGIHYPILLSATPTHGVPFVSRSQLLLF
ncbi:hypothetical protein K432DRAFT_76954 [Lepidopterella palustris CBS 459.81]|uniref:Uncharacterized protein n=1 Tax=Lepidopterella palustris CBS 459.81 TaxID=1314670 RepID=A0A8E2E841_9PEZI|nr:hypothetical protein K432DRAFT_76954 [Lepidopterella palustris CBS 459.81]